MLSIAALPIHLASAEPAPPGDGAVGALQGGQNGEPSWRALHAGLTREGLEVPRGGVSNRTLNLMRMGSKESFGVTVQHEGLAFVKGKTSWFGGPKDKGVGAKETGSITGEVLRKLDGHYCAMRWDLSGGKKASWRKARLLVVNPKSGKAVVVRVVDWGPSTRTKRIIDLSPQAMKDLGLTTDQEALVAFASPDAPLGPVR